MSLIYDLEHLITQYSNNDKYKQEFYERYAHKINTVKLNNNKPLDLSKFMKLKKLILPNNTLLTDDDLQHLKGIHTLNLKYNKNITNEGLVNLKGIHTLNLCWNQNITNEGLVHLKEAKNVYVNNRKMK